MVLEERPALEVVQHLRAQLAFRPELAVDGEQGIEAVSDARLPRPVAQDLILHRGDRQVRHQRRQSLPGPARRVGCLPDRLQDKMAVPQWHFGADDDIGCDEPIPLGQRLQVGQEVRLAGPEVCRDQQGRGPASLPDGIQGVLELLPDLPLRRAQPCGGVAGGDARPERFNGAARRNDIGVHWLASSIPALSGRAVIEQIPEGKGIRVGARFIAPFWSCAYGNEERASV